jgi:hypothetical protein
LVCVNLLKTMIGVGAATMLALLAYQFNIFPRFAPALSCDPGVVRAGDRNTDDRSDFSLHHPNPGPGMEFCGLLMPVSCIFYPIKALPGCLRAIAWMLPTAHSGQYPTRNTPSRRRKATACWSSWREVRPIVFDTKR